MNQRGPMEVAATRALLLGLGNVLLSDDGIGVHVVRALDAAPRRADSGVAVAVCDGGTLGLELLNQLDEHIDALIVVDATEFGAAPGTVQVFPGRAMDDQVGGRRRSVHEVALADLLVAASLTGRAPARRALVGIQPASTEWGLAPTEPVHAAIPVACRAVEALLLDWSTHHADR